MCATRRKNSKGVVGGCGLGLGSVFVAEDDVCNHPGPGTDCDRPCGYEPGAAGFPALHRRRVPRGQEAMATERGDKVANRGKCSAWALAHPCMLAGASSVQPNIHRAESPSHTHAGLPSLAHLLPLTDLPASPAPGDSLPPQMSPDRPLTFCVSG